MLTKILKGNKNKKMNQREFLYLCARGSAMEIADAVKAGASVNRRAKFRGASVPPLFVAVMEQNFDAIKVLFEHKTKNFPAFMAAMIMEDKKMLKYLVEVCGANINCKDQHKRTPLLCAVTANKTKIVKWLIELGANVNVRVGLGYNVLTYAALMFDDESGEQPDAEIIKILMAAGADYREAMLTAIKTNNVDLAKILIQNGADINKPYTMNQSALSLAILNIQYVRDKALPMIKFFIENGADVNEILDLSNDDNNEDSQPIFTTNLNVAISMESEKCLKLLLKNGANPNFIDSKGRTPLMYAVLTGLNTVEILLNYGADPNLGDLEGRTPLTLAVIDSDVEDGVIKTLLEHGASPNIRDNSGFTPLTWAVNDRDRSSEFFVAALIRTGAVRAEKGTEWYGLAVLFNALRREMQLENIRLLIDYGADVTIPDKKGVTALAWAFMNFDDEIADILKTANSKK